ncbi:cox cluster protein [Halomarina halobia]|uniref:Cox cluster protein n=1 Tax=Halomarina halobia TaxID=3033386 RepID=A0ABD6ACL7_9EURY|nr:cox cluster protein [Halomarina sp. PSR21]
MSNDTLQLRGPTAVLVLYAIVVAVAGGLGYILPIVRPGDWDPRLFGVVPLPGTSLGVAAYGAITLATILGVVIVAIVFVSNRYAEPVSEKRDRRE